MPVGDMVGETAEAPPDAPVLRRLSSLDRWLPLWIGAAMVLGILLGRTLPGLDDVLSTVEIGSVSLPIAALACW